MKTLPRHLPKRLAEDVAANLEDWRASGKVRRLWERDAALWTGRDEARWLDWLGIPAEEKKLSSELAAFADRIKNDFTHAVVLGMGGSSMCPEVLSRILGSAKGFPGLLALDSTDPREIASLESRVDLAKTLFLVASKSGSTLEPNILKDYFYDRVRRTVGAAEAGARFVAITDPGSQMQRAAEAQGFARIFFGKPGIGGRYSALSNFGMVPAAVMGVDVGRFLDRAAGMAEECASRPPEDNPGVHLGVVLGAAAKQGMDKVALIASPKIAPLGAWLEQLLAESSGKEGKALIPVDGEPLLDAARYGDDRLFIYLRAEWASDKNQDAAVAALEAAGLPVVRIAVAEAMDLGREFFRWEIATAVACSILGVNAFDQPDVEDSKVRARSLTDAYEKTGALPAETPFCKEGSLSLYADAKHTAALDRAAGAAKNLEGYLRAHLGLLRKGDYFALLAYIERCPENHGRLQGIRSMVLRRQGNATCLGFGPRFLHSTGQAYKGGPDTGVFLQITCDDPRDLPIPGRKSTFGVVKAAQARGDMEVLSARGRRALRVHLGADLARGLDALAQAVEKTLKK